MKKGRYGVRKIYQKLCRRSYDVNHKRVQCLMKILDLIACIRRKRKYSS